MNECGQVIRLYCNFCTIGSQFWTVWIYSILHYLCFEWFLFNPAFHLLYLIDGDFVQNQLLNQSLLIDHRLYAKCIDFLRHECRTFLIEYLIKVLFELNLLKESPKYYKKYYIVFLIHNRRMWFYVYQSR